MPLTLPSLDDRRFDDLLDAGRRMIPGLAPSWTDTSPSDPGITLVELFASVAEMLMYRVDRVSEANRVAFVKLLRGDPQWQPSKAIDEEIRDAVLSLRRGDRAVTAGDFQLLTEAHPSVARARGVPGADVELTPRRFDAAGGVSVLVVARGQSDYSPPSADLVAALKAYLAPRCLLTTRLQVAGPRYLKVRVRVRVFLFADQDEATARKRVEQRLAAHFHPLSGGESAQGWPFGGPVYLSRLYALLDGLEGIDHAESPDSDSELGVLTALNADAGDRAINEDIVVLDGGVPKRRSSFTGLRLEADELVELAGFPAGGATTPADNESFVFTKRLAAAAPTA